jgi:hypothetical protein
MTSGAPPLSTRSAGSGLCGAYRGLSGDGNYKPQVGQGLLSGLIQRRRKKALGYRELKDIHG